MSKTLPYMDIPYWGLTRSQNTYGSIRVTDTSITQHDLDLQYLVAYIKSQWQNKPLDSINSQIVMICLRLPWLLKCCHDYIEVVMTT